MSITLTLTGNTSVHVADYFLPNKLDRNYQCWLLSLDTYHSIPNVDVENNLFHIGKHVIKIPVGSYEISDISVGIGLASLSAEPTTDEQHY